MMVNPQARAIARRLLQMHEGIGGPSSMPGYVNPSCACDICTLSRLVLGVAPRYKLVKPANHVNASDKA